MFPDAFLPNLAIFVVAQVTAWVYLRTGLVATGVSIVVASWLAADVALVARFAYDDSGKVYTAALIALQGVTVISLLRLIVGRWRRSRVAFQAHRELTFQTAFRQWLRGELDPATDALRGIVRADPWDLTARLLLAKVLLAAGSERAARRQLAAARRLDRDDRYGDAIRHDLRDRSESPETEAEPAFVPEAGTTAVGH